MHLFFHFIRGGVLFAIMFCCHTYGSQIVLRDFTAMQLKEFDGGNATVEEISEMTEKKRAAIKPIYISYEGVVYDVSKSRNLFGKGGAYHRFAGRDISILAVQDNTVDPLNDGVINGVPSDVEQWLSNFKFEFPLVGMLTTPPSGLRMTKTEFNKFREESMKAVATGKKANNRVDLPVYVIINRRIIDVSYGGMKAYGPGGSYGILAWKDITLALATMSLEADDVNKSDNMPFDQGIKGLSTEEVKVLAQWENMFIHTKKYPIVGRIVGN